MKSLLQYPLLGIMESKNLKNYRYYTRAGTIYRMKNIFKVFGGDTIPEQLLSECRS